MKSTPLSSAAFRQARPADFAAAWSVVCAARSRMLGMGRRQWDATYPAPADIRSDIHGGHAYVCDEDGMILAYGAIAIGGEPAYDALEGRWSRPGSYAVVHRLCVTPKAQRRGLARRFLHEAEAWARAAGAASMRIDTNYDNVEMQALLQSEGYIRCGTVRYGRGERQAFDKPLGALPSR